MYSLSQQKSNVPPYASLLKINIEYNILLLYLLKCGFFNSARFKGNYALTKFREILLSFFYTFGHFEIIICVKRFKIKIIKFDQELPELEQEITAS